MKEFHNYFFDPEGDFSELSDDEREYIQKQSMLNTYTLIINNYDFEIFPKTLFWLLTDYDELSVFDVLIKYFSHLDREDYEKCARLRDIKIELNKNKKKRTVKRGKFTYNIKPKDE